jgi:hypothetical protein
VKRVKRIDIVKNAVTRHILGFALPLLLATALALPAQEAAFSATGGSVSYYAMNGTNFTTHSFTSVGSSTFQVSGGTAICDILVVAGGGAGGGQNGGGGGGAGGLVHTQNVALAAGTYVVTVGAGGLGVNNATGGSGGNGVFGELVTVIGGGGGGGGANGLSGGSGGGGGMRQKLGGSGTPGQGHDGGDSHPINEGYAHAGGAAAALHKRDRRVRTMVLLMVAMAGTALLSPSPALPSTMPVVAARALREAPAPAELVVAEMAPRLVTASAERPIPGAAEADPSRRAQRVAMAAPVL